MTIAVAQHTGLTNTPTFTIGIVNQLAAAMSGNCVTTNSSIAVGDAGITGNLSGNGVYANSVVWVGNSSVNAVVNSTAMTISNSTVSLVLSLPTISQVANGAYTLSSAGTWVPLGSQSTSLTTTGFAAATIDSWSTSLGSAANYSICVVSTSSNQTYTSHITTMSDGVGAYISEYGDIASNGSVGVFSVSQAFTTVTLTFTPTVAGSNVTFTRTLV